MKKETVNIFNKGLNYDLNPMTTPSDVLTDCVNGTFVTFNGDELILQNDAGNTKILKPKKSPNDPDEYITLSPGFQPIGIKEKGGILYIVSAKSPLLNARMWDENESYSVGEIVLNKEIYYLVTSPIIGGNTTDALIMTESEYFLMMENESLIQLNSSLEDLQLLGPISVAPSKLKEKLKELNITLTEEIEFGSYPSQEVYEVNSDISTPRAITLEDPVYHVVSDKLFTAGTYVEFTNGSWTHSQNLLSTYSLIDGNLIKHKRFYTIKLLQQLDNGVIDLTEDIWYKYLTKYPQTVGNSYDSWLNVSAPFKYYCPNNYKGKLLLYPEIETLDQFEVTSANVVISSYDGSKRLKVSAIVKNADTSWAISPILRFYSDKNAEWGTHDDPTCAGSTYTWDISIQPDISILYYQVYVIVIHRVPGHSDNNINPVFPETFGGAPAEFINTLIKSGTLLTNMGVKDVNISTQISQLGCHQLGDTWYQIYDKIFITNLEGQYIDPREGSEDVPPFTDRNNAYYVSYEEDTESRCVGTFTVGSDNKVDSLNSSPTLNNSNTILELLKNTIVKFESPSCGGILLNLLPAGSSSRWSNLSVNISQGNSNLYSDPMQDLISIKALPNEPITLNISESDLFYPTVDKSFTITESTTSLKIAPVLKFKVETRVVNSASNEGIDELVINTDISEGFRMQVSVFGGGIGNRKYDISRGNEPVDQIRIPLTTYRARDSVSIRRYNIIVESGVVVENSEYANLTVGETDEFKFKSHTLGSDVLITKKRYILDTEIIPYNN